MDSRLELVEEIRRHIQRHGLDAAVKRYADTLASWPGEAAGIWLRVSSGGQDEANQLPDVLIYCAGHRYRPVSWYVLHDKSAAKGEQQAKLDEMLTDVRDRAVSVCVCWHGDRLERRGGMDLLKILADVKDAGGRVDSVKQHNLGLETMGDRLSSFISGEMAHEYIVHLTEQVKISHNRIKANGGVGPGGIPWGYKVIGEKYNKRMVPTEECKKYVPQMFERCIAGQSCRKIALWLDAEGVKPTRGEIWNDNSVWGMLQNMAYAGRRQDEGPLRTTGKKSPSRKNRRTIMTCEAVITMDTYRRAQEALHKRPPAGPYKEPPLLVGLKCARCASRGIDSPMYRMRKYYRCFGRGTRRKSCGNMIPMDQLDMIVIVRVFTTSTEPYQTKVWVPGKNWDAEIADTLQSLHELDPIDDEDYDERHAELIAKLREYKRKNREESTAGHYEKKDVRKPDGSIMTEGEHFRDLDEDGQREYLKTHDIQAEKVIIPEGYPAPRSTIGTPGIRVVIDGNDYGITPIVRPGSFDRMRATA